MRTTFLLALLAFTALGSALLLGGRPEKAGAVPDIAALVDRIDQQRIYDYIDAIDEPRNAFVQPETLQATADYVESQLVGLGYPVTLDPVTFSDVTFPNVTGVHEGTVCPERVFVVGAHYDSVWATPGADDDASGIAGMLEMARALADTPLPATVWFTGFTMEENGLVGSFNMAQEEAAAGTPIVGMFSLEMIGYTTVDADFIAVIGNEASVRLVDSFIRASDTYVPDLPTLTGTVPGNGETVPDIRRSDHAPFWDVGYQGLLVTDTANFRNPNYHQSTDTIDTLDLGFVTNVTKAMLATTVDYLTYDGDSDGQPDVCTGPLSATATPAPTPTPTITPTPCPGGKVPANGGCGTPTPTKQLDPGDTDGDGCSDQRENGLDETQGGLRDYKNRWDYYDVAGVSGPDQFIDLGNDILGVILHYAPSGGPPYDAAFDRGPSAGPNSWNMTAPDGVIDLGNDILGVILQYAHSCQ